VQNYASERQSQIFASGEQNPRRHSLILPYAPYRIIIENAPKGSDDTHQRKRRRLARGVHGRHAQDMSLITSDNVHQRPQWRVTPLGRLIRPMRMRPARPLDPPLDTLRTKNDEKGTRTKKKRAKAPPTRARRQTIDPLRWGSTHLSGIFLDGNGNALPPVRTGPDGDGSAKGESTEVDEVEHILEVSDQTPSGDDKMHPRASDTELDLAAERASALDLLSAMFGDTNADWGGAESIDSDVEMVGVDAGKPRAPSDLLEPIDFEDVLAAHTPHTPQREEKTSAVDRQTEASPAPQQLTLSRLHKTSSRTCSHLGKRKVSCLPFTVSSPLQDLLPSSTGFSLIGHLDLDSELDLDMDLHLDEPTFPNTAATAPMATSSRSALSAAVLTMQHKALDSSLPFFFPQKGHVQRVKFARTEDEAEIRARWEVARGELTREWKRRHREAVKSRRRRGGEQVE
jgi:hypothetical protein